MEITTFNAEWPTRLLDPSGRRMAKPRTRGYTMVIDKGLGLHAFTDLLNTAGDYIDIVKFGFGTSTLYPPALMREKIELARKHGIVVMPGGTLLEAAVKQDLVPAFFRQVLTLGFNGIEVSDGTIVLSRRDRDDLIRDGVSLGLKVYTEYGKKLFGSRIDVEEFTRTAEQDWACGADLVTVEARESGVGVGLFDEHGNCRESELQFMASAVPQLERVMWEAPQKDQQVSLIKSLGSDVNLGNISVQDVIALETMRRGLRSDTFHLQSATFVADYVI
ncbi:phosphosulfolactate synthase [Cohnella yongneupensis]|uniref:Phosphosulfolactate synthase n=1 Tax=Cohnella yongneupensis TaxID=425006 RepID=A0ABW0R6H5_9BACL